MQVRNIIMSDVFTKSELSKIMRKDATMVASNVKKYCDQNADKYAVVINTWFYMCTQYCSPRHAYGLLGYIEQNGLLKVIGECSDLASRIIESNFTLDDLGKFGFMMNENPRITLQLLRYPKRFSPSAADKVRDDGMRRFLALNNAMKGEPTVIFYDGKVLERDITYPRFVIEGVSDYCRRLLHTNITPETPLELGRFSSGVTAEGCKTLFEKQREFCRISPGYKDTFLYPLPRFGNEDFGYCDDIDYVKAVAVPKNYKVPRIIAEVSAYTQYHMQGIRRAIVRSLKTSEYADLIILDDQSINQEWSRLGSIYGTFCTIDLASASDSISNHLARKVLPTDWYDVIQSWNPPYIMSGGRKYKRNIFLTSGSGDTFAIESVIFLAIALFATEMVETLTGEELNQPRVYGDDIICDTRAYDTTVDFLEMLCFTVNRDKSFHHGDYRESCGAEWWCGLDTATKYFPRRAFDERSPEYLQGLISLQHRLYEFESCELWLTNHIQRIFSGSEGRRMTSSRPGEECNDLWNDFPQYVVNYPPYDHSKGLPDCVTREKDMRRETHYNLVPVGWGGVESKRFQEAFMEHYSRPFVSNDLRVCEMFRYVDFLQHGTPLDEFGVPVHRQDVSDDLLNPELAWRLSRR